jgi:DNA topoisomerase IA
MSPAKIEKTKVLIDFNNEIHHFIAEGEVIKFD